MNLDPTFRVCFEQGGDFVSDTVLIAGATGGLGQHIVQKLLRINQRRATRRLKLSKQMELCRLIGLISLQR